MSVDFVGFVRSRPGRYEAIRVGKCLPRLFVANREIPRKKGKRGGRGKRGKRREEKEEREDFGAEEKKDVGTNTDRASDPLSSSQMILLASLGRRPRPEALS